MTNYEARAKRLGLVLMSVGAIGTAGIAFAQAPAPSPSPATSATDAQAIISKQLGDLLIANAQCAAQVQGLAAQLRDQSAKLGDLQKRLDDTIKKCGAPCGGSAGDTPGESEKKMSPLPNPMSPKP